jgi:hypothetical protein
MIKTLTRTLYPELVDANIANSTKFLNEYSDYLTAVGALADELGDFIDETNASIDYRNALKSGNPVTNVASFFKDLDNKKLKTFNNDFIYFWYKKYQSSLDIIKAEIKKDEETRFSGSVDRDVDTYNNLTFSNEYLQGFNATSSTRSKNYSYLGDMSDSIGILANIGFKIDDATGYLWDVQCNKGVPAPFPPTLHHKVSQNTREISFNLSKKNTSMMRTNLINLQRVSKQSTNALETMAATSVQSHGTNLVGDMNFVVQFYTELPQIVQQLVNQFGQLYYEFISYFNTINDIQGYNPRVAPTYNKQFITNIEFELDVEGTRQKLDLLQKKIMESTSTRTIANTISVERLNAGDPLAPNITTNSINNRFLFQEKTYKIPIPASLTEFATKKLEIAQGVMSLPNQSLNTLNNVLDKININNIPGIDAALGPLNSLGFGGVLSPFSEAVNGLVTPARDIIGSIGALTQNPFSILGDSVKINGATNGILPSIDLGSIPEISALITRTNLGSFTSFNLNSIGNVFELAQSVKGIVCNFELPIIGKIDPSFVFDIEFDPDTLYNKLLSMLPKMPTKDDFKKLLKNLTPNFKQIFKNLFDKFFTCNNNNNF